MKYLPEKSVKKLLKTMLFSKKPVYLEKGTEKKPNNNTDDEKRSESNLTYSLKELKN